MGSAKHLGLYSFLSRHKYGVVSTVSSDGSPQSALVGIATTPDLELVFDTVSSSRKYANLRADPSCSFVVGWENEQSLQYEGIAFEPRGAELERYQQIYFSAWPDSRAHLKWATVAYFAVRPSWIRHSDFARSPALIEEFSFH